MSTRRLRVHLVPGIREACPNVRAPVVRVRSLTARGGAGLVALALLVAAAPAQPPPAAPPHDPSPPLSGPRIHPDRPPALEQGLGAQRRARTPGVPMRVFLDALNRLRRDDLPDDVRLSPQQQEHIVAILRQSERRADRPGPRRDLTPPGRPEGPPPPDTPRRAEPREPSPADIQTRIWSLLNDRQRDILQRELEQWRQDASARRMQEQVQREIERRRRERQGEPGRPAPPTIERPDASGPIPGAPGRERARRILDKLLQLPPDERERILQQLEDDLDRRLREPAAPEPQPRPPMDDMGADRPAAPPPPDVRPRRFPRA